VASDPFYVTTPLFYVNAAPHLGHAYVAIVGDTLARFWRARGREVFALTGTDEHGDKIAQAAAAAGVTPKAHADRVSGLFRATWEQAGLRFDHFIRTTDDYHVAFVRRVLADIHQRGDIYFGSYTGLYCYGCERFYQERELANGLCPDHRVAPTEIAEENYFFRMGAYQDRLREALETRPGLITPTGTAARSSRSSASRSAISASRGRRAASRGASSCPSTSATSRTSGSTRSSTTSRRSSTSADAISGRTPST
jgi:methionyl-tRNA synthetase